MKNLFVVALALVVPMSAIATAQLATPDNHQSQAQRMSAKTLRISGRVNREGTTLVSDNTGHWTVTNPDMLKGYEGHPVTVKCRADHDNHTIHILSIKRERGEVNYSARNGDSAFRR